MKRENRHTLFKVFKAIICLTLLCTANMSYGQALNELQNSFNNTQKAALHEKLYLHISKTTFITGEPIWFKIYNTEGGTNKLLDISKVAYVELLDTSHTAVMQAKIALNAGTGSGFLQLPSALGSGNYQLRAYTNWMKNFDPELYFSKPITIINPHQNLVNHYGKTINYDIQFLPEGGHLVSGLSSKVAFKVTASNGKPVNCGGAILNRQNDTIVRFQTLKLGIGSFLFTPQGQQSDYTAIIKIDGKSIIKELLEISPSGYVMHTTTSARGWDLDVKTSGLSSSNVYLIVHTNNSIEMAEYASFTGGNAHFFIDKSKVNEGISYVTLFDEQKRPLCERLIFNRPKRKLFINAATDLPVYQTRKKVRVNISTQDQTAKSTSANLSLTVYRLDSLQSLDNSHIASYLWLSADVKGKIESPDYYFDNDTPESNQALDNLLLSQGWTQFDWKDVLASAKVHYNYLPEYTGPIVTANLVNARTNSPAPNINAFLTVPGKYHQLYVAKSDSGGKLMFNTKNNFGSREVIVKTDTRHDSTYRINILSPFSEQYANEQLPLFTINADMGTLITNYISTQVTAIFGKDEFETPQIDTSYFYRTPPYTYKLDDYTRFKTIDEVMHEYVRFVSVTNRNGRPLLRMSYNKSLLPGQATALIDGEPIFESGDIYKIDPLKIKRLDVINNYYVYGPMVFDGIISLTTYNGNGIGMVLDPQAVTVDYEGLQLQRKFYSPVYDSDQQRNGTRPDFRTTLLWEPSASTGVQGTGSLTFYTGDKAGKYIGIIEGITPSGGMDTQRFYFEVKK